MKLFTLMKGIFGKPAPAPEPDVDFSTEDRSPDSASVSELAASAPAVAVTAPTAYRPAFAVPEVDVTSSEIVLPLASIVASFPVELQQRVRTHVIGQSVCAFPLDKILSQLSQGLVRVTFGEIRQSAPEAFTTGSDRDFVMINLPLNELVSRLAPTLLGLRARRQIEVPEEIISPFGPNGQGLALGKRVSDPSLTTRPRGAQSIAPVPPAMDPRARGNVTSVPKPATPGGGTTIFVKKPATPPPNGSSLPPTRTPNSSAPPIGTVPMGGGFQKPSIMPSHRPVPGSNGSQGNGFHPVTPVPPSPGKVAPSNSISISLVSLGEALPETLRLEVAGANLNDAHLALPQEEVEAGLKRGKLVFTWKQLRGWLKPAPPTHISAHDGLMVALPLAIVAPLFLGRQKALGMGQKRVVVDEKIPNLFFGFPQPEPAPQPIAPQAEIPIVPAPKPAETNYFVFDDDDDKAPAISTPVPQPFRPASAPGTTFASRKATPNEIVMKASLLEGVYGALVALPDGLLVAAKLDPSVNGETIAALIPQMYSKLSGCTKELRMGELNNLNFTVGNVPWKIFRVNGIFFAAFGCAGEPLPTAHLAELAAALDYKKAH